MIKLLHTADIHLGSPLATLPEAVARVLRDELFSTLSRIVELANDERVDALLIAGDLFDEAYPPRSVAARAFELLGLANCPVFISPGNHDPATERSPYRTYILPKNVHVFLTNAIEKVSFDDFDIYGAGFTASTISHQILHGFRADPGRKSVMLLHGETESNAAYHAIDPRDIAASGLSYLALGHYHSRYQPAIVEHTTLAYPGTPHDRSFTLAGSTVFAYPGSPHERSFSNDRERGCYIVELDDEVRVRFAPLGARRFLTIESADGSIPDGHERDLVRLVLAGESSEISAESIEKALSGKVFYLKVVDQRKPAMRIWERLSEDTLAGEFLAALEKMRQNGADAATIELAARLGIAALDGEEAPL